MKIIIFSICLIFFTGFIFSQSIINTPTGSNNSTISDNNALNRTETVSAISKTYIISATAFPILSGTITGTGIYNNGSTVNLIAKANMGYVFTKWTERSTSVSTNATYSFKVTASRTLIANFTQLKKYTISVSVSPKNSGTVAGAGTYYEDSIATLIATANKGYAFINWTVDKTIVSTSSSFSFVVNMAQDLVANFAVNNLPTASNVSINGPQFVCKKLTGYYSYSNINGSSEQRSTFRWYRASTLSLSDTVFITGAIGLTYTLTDADSGKYIYFRVTPVATKDAIVGVSVLSSPTSIILKSTPRVTLTAIQNIICQGQSTIITMSLIGTPPYYLVYTDGSIENSIHVLSDTFTFSVFKEGKYKVDTIMDYNSCPIANPASVVNITVNPLPVVKISGLNNTYYLSDTVVSLHGIPTGGMFTGDGVVSSSNLFYPSIAGVVGSPHSIVYSYTSTVNGCKNTDTVKINVITNDAYISVLRSSGKYCNYDSVFLVKGSNASGLYGTFSISGGIGLTNNGNNTATINPSMLNAGNYIISYTYFNNVSSTISKSITIEKFASPVILGVNQPLYCSNNPKIQLSVNNYTEGAFSGNGVVMYSNNQYYFDPSIAVPGRTTINFTYTTSYGCKVSDSIITQISQSPIALFSIQNKCWKGDSTVFINLTKQVNSINHWEWHYGDNSAPADKNISYKFEQKHLYPTNGDYSVMLIARNTNNCSDTIQKNVHLNDIPVVNFNWKSECFTPSIPVRFNNLTTSKDLISSYKWVIQDASNAIIQLNAKNIQHIYRSINNYPVKLVATSTNGCRDSITKTIMLRPVFSLKDSIYFNSFEVNSGYWYSGSSVNKWTWGIPNGEIINSAYSGNKAIYTAFNLSRKSEQLEITSPCYDFTDVKRPYIQMWVNSNSEARQEGAVLQYAIDTVLQWKNVSTKGLGINWYNDDSIMAAPGKQAEGWSGTTGWIRVRNNLDALNGFKNVRFRLIYGSNSISTIKDGFAFDEVFIGKRSNMVLFEHFTDMSSTKISQSNRDVDNILQAASEDALGIQYHLSFSKSDTLTNSQSVTRFLYYGAGANNMPQCYLDGGSNSKYVYDFSTQLPSLKDVYVRVLKDDDYSIIVAKNKSSEQVSGTIIIKALKDIVIRDVGVFVAVVEDIIVQSDSSAITYKNVLKTMLPSNVGYNINKSLIKSEEISFQYNWQPQGIYNAQKLKLVVFIQDYKTNEIYQVTGSNAGLMVGNKNVINGTSKVLDIVVYPNPAKDRITVEFGENIPLGFEIRLIGQTGKILRQVKLLSGISAVGLDVSDCPAGLYFISIYNSRTNIIKNLKVTIR